VRARLGGGLVVLVVALILFVLLLVATLIGGMGVVLVARVLAQFSGLSVFEASLIALGVAFALGYFLMQALRPQHILEPVESDSSEEDFDEDEEDFEDEEEEEEEPPRPTFVSKYPLGRRTPYHVEPPPNRNDPCPCGSGRKYKNCHGKNA
jgi:hypothetical protein